MNNKEDISKTSPDNEDKITHQMASLKDDQPAELVPEPGDKEQAVIQSKSAQPKEEKASADQQAKKSEGEDNSRKQYLAGIGFLGLLIIGIAIVQTTYSLMHGINPLNVYRGIPFPIEFDFIGGVATPYTIGQEVLFWAFTGVSCKMAYDTAKKTMRKRFNFLQQMVLWISTSVLAWGIGVGLIFSLSLISLNIAGNIINPIGSIETVIAISFILGFYHEESLKLLGSIREKLSLGDEVNKEVTPQRSLKFYQKRRIELYSSLWEPKSKLNRILSG